jgi:hypothetical protein
MNNTVSIIELNESGNRLLALAAGKDERLNKRLEIAVSAEH